MRWASSQAGEAARARGSAPAPAQALPPPTPNAKPSRLSGVPAAEHVTVIYDYEAQAEGDLSFTSGDATEICLAGIRKGNSCMNIESEVQGVL
jgi:amphiphysin